MKEVTLYGLGAVTLHDGKNVVRSANGCIVVPEHLVARVEAMGFTRTIRGEPEADQATDIPTAIPPGETPDEKVARYRAEIEARGYKGEAVDTILAERLRFDELVASGKTDEEAAAIVWGGHDAGEPTTQSQAMTDLQKVIDTGETVAGTLTPSAPPVTEEKVEEKANADVGALSADVNEDDVAKKVD